MKIKMEAAHKATSSLKRYFTLLLIREMKVNNEKRYYMYSFESYEAQKHLMSGYMD